MNQAPKPERRWLVLNQSQSPQFQAMLEKVAEELGPCEVMTGTPFPAQGPALKIVPGPRYIRASLFRRAFSWLRFLFSAAWRALAGPRPRLIFVTTNPPFLSHLAWLTKKIRGVPYILLIWDIYPDHAVQQGWLRADGLVERMWNFANRLAMRSAARTVTIGSAMANTLTARAPGMGVEVIPNWADTDTIRPIAKTDNEFAINHGQVDCLTVLYSGNVGRTHGVHLLVEAAAQLRDLQDVWFLVIGDGLGMEAVRAAAERLDVRNITLLPMQPWHTVPKSLATGDIAVVFQDPQSAHLSVPSKTYSLMAAGCAIVASTEPGSDLAELVEAHQIGRVATAGDAEALAYAIRALHGDRAALSAARLAARRVAVENASVDFAAGEFSKLLGGAMGRGA